MPLKTATNKLDQHSAPTILLIDPDCFSREAIASCLVNDFSCEPVHAETCDEAVQLADDSKPDLVIFNLPHTTDNSNFDLPSTVAKFPESKFVLLTASPSMQLLDDAFDCGMAGVLSKSTTPEEFIRHLQAILTDHWVFIRPTEGGPAPTEQLREGFYRTQIKELSSQDQDIVRDVALGFTNGQIARKLHMSEGSIKLRITRILTTLNLTSRTQLSIVATDAGLVRVRDLLRLRDSNLKAGAKF